MEKLREVNQIAFEASRLRRKPRPKILRLRTSQQKIGCTSIFFNLFNISNGYIHKSKKISTT